MRYIKAEYTGNELDFRGNACSVIEYVAFACGVAKCVLEAITVKENDEELFEGMKTARIRKSCICSYGNRAISYW